VATLAFDDEKQKPRHGTRGRSLAAHCHSDRVTAPSTESSGRAVADVGGAPA